MTLPIISIEHISKRYEIGAHRESYLSLRDTLAAKARHAWAVVAGKERLRPATEAFWALRDISFEVHRGECIGIIGRNGAGKSTLLKVLSRITPPTEGRITCRGRVASLLEVGTGFHPELTGRENIFLNGTILGMTRREIASKFDEIVAFSEIEGFLDTPVKRYSSGMYVRLAFAVAAHLEPEILVVDEVLAVGDIAFQRKCLGKMDQVARQGRTVLFVSHNTQAISALCGRCVLLGDGRKAGDGPTAEVLGQYRTLLSGTRIDAATGQGDPKSRRGSGAVRVTGLRVQDAQGKDRNEFEVDEPVRLALSWEVLEDVPDVSVSVYLRTGMTLEFLAGTRQVLSGDPLPKGATGTSVLELYDTRIRPGEYPLYVWMGDRFGRPYDVLDGLTHPLIFSTQKSFEELGYAPAQPSGAFSLPSRWID